MPAPDASQGSRLAPGPRVTAALPLLALGAVIFGAAVPPELVVSPDAPAPATAPIEWVLRILLTTVVAVVAVLGPGLALRSHLRQMSGLGHLGVVWLPGTLLMVGIGLVTWASAAYIDPQTVATAALAGVFAWLAWAGLRTPLASLTSGAERRILVVFLVVVLIAIAKGTYSQGPEGELFGTDGSPGPVPILVEGPATISRTLEVGTRPDSRIPFHTIQMVAHGLGPGSEIAQNYFEPFNFGDRGQVVPMVAAPVVLSSGGQPPIDFPDQPWAPFDQQGFAAFRVVYVVLAACVVLAVFGLLSRFLSERDASRGALVVALTPFFLHELYFTWPKLLVAGFLVVGIALLFDGRPGLAGGALALAFLSHPVALAFVPAVLAIWALVVLRGTSEPCDRDPEPRSRDVLTVGTIWVVGVLGPTVIVWQLLTIGEGGQAGFVEYVRLANGFEPESVQQWVGERFRSLANTLVPLRLFLFDRGEVEVNALFTPSSPGAVQFFFAYWTTLPFAVGIAYFPAFLAGLYRLLRRSGAVVLVGVVAPFVLFWLYWGASSTGMAREGLHFWIVVALVAAYLGHGPLAGRTTSPVLAKFVQVGLTVRALEVLAMLLVPAVATMGVFGRRAFMPTDVASLAVMFVGVGWLAAATWLAFRPPVEGAARPQPAVDAPSRDG